MYEEEGLYYLCSENKGADQLRGYREADLRLCFRICIKSGFLLTRLKYNWLISNVQLSGKLRIFMWLPEKKKCQRLH